MRRHLMHADRCYWTRDRKKRLRRAVASGTRDAVLAAVFGTSCLIIRTRTECLRRRIPAGDIEPVADLVPAAAVRVEEIRDGYVTILNVSDGQCRWPFGDPQTAGFRLCGRAVRAGAPYCPEHCSVAYEASRPAANAEGKQRKSFAGWGR